MLLLKKTSSYQEMNSDDGTKSYGGVGEEDWSCKKDNMISKL